MPRSPDDLFDELIRSRQLISYIDAYRELIDQSCRPWRNRRHAPKVIGIAQTTTPRLVAGLRIRLDALMVSKKIKEPGGNHFDPSPGYDLATWRRAFGTWPRKT